MVATGADVPGSLPVRRVCSMCQPVLVLADSGAEALNVALVSLRNCATRPREVPAPMCRRLRRFPAEIGRCAPVEHVLGACAVNQVLPHTPDPSRRGAFFGGETSTRAGLRTCCATGWSAVIGSDEPSAACLASTFVRAVVVRMAWSRIGPSSATR